MHLNIQVCFFFFLVEDIYTFYAFISKTNLRIPPSNVWMALTTTSIPLSPLSCLYFFEKPLHHHSFHPPPPLSPRRPKSSNVSLVPTSLLTKPILKSESFHDDHPPAPPPPHSLRRLLRLAAEHQDLALGRAAHAFIAKTQQHQCDDEETRLVNTLISTYLKLGHLADARKTFDGFLFPDVVSFTSLISSYAKCGREAEAVGLFNRMRQTGIEPNEYTFVAILTSCIRNSNSQLGSQVHALAIKTHKCYCLHVANALMGMYVKCEDVAAAFQLFDEMPERDVSSWNAVLLGMVEDGRCSEAFELFHDLRMEVRHGDRFSLSSLLTAAAQACARAEGEVVHAYALKIGLELDLSVGNALVGFYMRVGCIEHVIDVFQRMPIRDVISWTGVLTGFMEVGEVESAVQIFTQMPKKNHISYNALLDGFCKNGKGSRGLELFHEIIEDSVEISDVTLTSVVNACAMVSDMKMSKQIHAFVIKVGCQSNAQIKAGLLDMYAKCGRMEDAEKMFERWTHEISFSIAWTSLICARARNGQPDEAISLFHSMLKRDDGVTMDRYLLATVLGVCGTLGFGEMGKQIHCHVLKHGFLSDLTVGNALFSMYAKCWKMEDAISSFNQMPRHDIVSWNTLITAYLLHRQGDRALDAWSNMNRLGVKPNYITFILIISVCRYTGTNSIDTCHKLFHSMRSSYDIVPASEHYAAMVDVLGYWGCFDEAEKLINSMPFKPDASVWRALLDSCRLRSNLSLGRQAVQHLLALEPQDPSTYILVSNLYSASGRWQCSEKVREEMLEKGFHKHPARSWIIHQNAVHSFYARDRLHQQSKDIYSGLEILIHECMKAGYVPDTSFVLQEVEEYQKKDFLFYHSAKLVVAWGLLMTSPGQTMQIVKNIRLCGDCHTFLKCVSSVTWREISVRDATGFHNFKGGRCSCGDYW